jgi:glycosyltransferase involved in cell wall biosynthesis
VKVFFSNVNLGSRSGPNTFAGRLATQLVKNGHTISSSGDSYDSVLAFIELDSLPRQGSRIVQRLDGIWFKPGEFLDKNINIKRTYNLSDHVIFQSQFDKQMVEHHWGSVKESSVIHNGIDLRRVEVTHDQIKMLQQSFDRIFVSSASWHRQKRLRENTDLFIKIAGEDPRACFVVLGRNPDHVVSHPRIFYVGDINHDLCLQIYRIASWMIHLAWLDHCPNVVVEAISQGCPVICTDSGGTQEIVRSNGVIVPEKSQYRFELADYDNPPDFDLTVEDLPAIDIQNDYLDIESVAKKYESAIFGK